MRLWCSALLLLGAGAAFAPAAAGQPDGGRDLGRSMAESAWAELTLAERLLALTEWRLGVPYELGCLGEGEGAEDEDPVFRTDRADCTVLVLTDAALAHACNLPAAPGWMAAIHYKDGVPSYETRYHFTTDRITSSPYFMEITAAPESLLVPVRVTLNRKASGEPLLALDWEREVEIAYLPSTALGRARLGDLPAVCGVAFVNEVNARSGYLVSHEGLLLDGKTLHHASTLTGNVANMDLEQYLFEGRERARFDGMLFFGFR